MKKCSIRARVSNKKKGSIFKQNRMCVTPFFQWEVNKIVLFILVIKFYPREEKCF